MPTNGVKPVTWDS